MDIFTCFFRIDDVKFFIKRIWIRKVHQEIHEKVLNGLIVSNNLVFQYIFIFKMIHAFVHLPRFLSKFCALNLYIK